MNWSEWFYYDETSPTFLRWRVERRGGINNLCQVVAPHDKAGCITKNGYGEVKLKGISYKAHRIIYELFIGDIPEGVDIDHEDGNRINNRLDNLRLCTDLINSHNRCMRYDNKSGCTGVNKMSNGYGRNYWLARWMREGKERSKSFSIEDFGSDVAFKMAVEHREQMLLKLVEEGQHYTERHGKCLKQK